MTEDTCPKLAPCPLMEGIRPAAQASFLLICVLIVLLLPFFFGFWPATYVPLAYLLPLFLPPLIWLAVRLLLAGPGPLSPAVLLAGVSFILGGQGFDILATVIQSPSLEREANPVARTLLDSAHGLPFVYVYGLLAQGMIGLLLCLWWAGYLNQYEAWLAHVYGARPSSFSHFLRLQSGGLTWQQLILPYRNADFVAIFRTCGYWFLPSMIIVALTVTFGRWYIGLVWFELVPYCSVVLLYLIALVFTLPLYVLWMLRVYWRLQKGSSASSSGEAGPRSGPAVFDDQGTDPEKRYGVP